MVDLTKEELTEIYLALTEGRWSNLVAKEIATQKIRYALSQED